MVVAAGVSQVKHTVREVLLASRIDAAATAELASRHRLRCEYSADSASLQEAVRDAEVAVLRSGPIFDRQVLSQASRLQLMIRAGSGTDNIDLGYLEERAIRLLRIPEPGARAVAELAFGLMLGLARRVVEADGLSQKGIWAKADLEGVLLRGKTLGIVGAGNIGAQIGRLGAAWGMRSIGCVSAPCEEERIRLHRADIEMLSFETVVQTADFLSINVPLSASTRGLINRDVIASMKPGSFLVNLARGGVVDEAALRVALLDGRLRGAALDVHEKEGKEFASPLAGMPRVILTPHIGAMAADAQKEIGDRIVAAVNSL